MKGNVMKTSDRGFLKKVIAGGGFNANMFEFPDQQRVFHSMRFGEHDVSLDCECLRILPVRRESEPAEPVSAALRKAGGGKFTAIAPVSPEARRRRLAWPGKVARALVNCKACAASFFW
jgi:hypothetical protein